MVHVFENASEVFSEDINNKFEKDKTNKRACAPSEDSDHTGYPPSLI